MSAFSGFRRGKLLLSLVAATALALAALWLWQHPGLGALLTLETLKASRASLQTQFSAAPLATASAFFALYVLVAALSIPGAVILTLAAGALFGLGWGLVLVSFASSLGALLAFLAARYLLRTVVQRHFAQVLAPINEGVVRSGSLYLFTLRLVPIFPFTLINLLMGLTPMSARRFYVVSQIGMLAGTAVYVNAGTQLSALESVGDVLSPRVLVSFALLGLFPFLARLGVKAMETHRRNARWQRPWSFDRNLVVIGAGAGGLVTAYIAAAVKARVTLIEGHRMGGDCLNTGCVPSKALIRAARAAHQIRSAPRLGLHAGELEVDFAAVMQRVHQVIAEIAPHDSVARYTDLDVEVLAGHARITSPWTVSVKRADGSERTLSTRAIVIAAGAQPTVPSLPGLDETGYLTSDTVWGLSALPPRLLVLGGGPIGCELAQCFARLGSAVTLIESGPRLLSREDPEVSALLTQALEAEGVTVLTGHRAVRVEKAADEKRLVTDQAGTVIVFDELLCAVGRSPRVSGYGLEELGIPLGPGKTIETNAYLQTLYPNIYAVGDVAGPLQLTHAAAHQAWYAAVNALFGRFRRFKVDLRCVPAATFTEPEVARVGLNETEATAQGIAYEVTRYGLEDLDRAIADDAKRGFVKVLTVPGRDRILGVTLVGEHAGDLIAEYVLAMKHGLGLHQILGTVHIYPTLAEANKYVAGEWKRAHAPQGLLRWAERYHRWMRR